MESMDSMSHLLFNQIEQIADVKTCSIDNIEQRYYKVQWKCTWEPAIVLERFCGKIVADYERGPSSCRTQVKTVEKTKRQNLGEGNCRTNIVEKSVNMIENHEETEQFEDTCSLFSSSNSFKELQLQRDNIEEHIEQSLNHLNEEADKISSANEVQNVINEILPVTNNKLNLHNFDIKPEPTDDGFLNNISTADESSTTNEEQNNGLSVSFDPCNNFSSNINLKNATISSSNTRRDQRNQLTRNCFRCNLCSYFSPKSSNLKRHMLKHTGEKPFKCSLCSYSAARKSYIKIHMSKHTGDYLFGCDWCSYSTNLHTSMKRHSMTHTGEKPFKCDQCEYGTMEKSNLNKHLQLHQ